MTTSADQAAPQRRAPSVAPDTQTRPRVASRLAVALLVGMLSAAYVFWYARANPDFVSDFDQVWAGAAAIWRGQNPYIVVGPTGSFHWRWPLYYPMPAIVVAAPLGLLPVVVARVIFAGVSAALLAFGISRDGFSRWPVFISLSFIVNVELVQWSSLLAAAALLPGMSWLAIAKPNIGLALLASARRNRYIVLMVGGGAALTAVSFAILPDWVHYWRANVRSATHFVPLVLRPGGFLLALAALRWRRPEARLLLALSCSPLTPTFYDPVLLFLVAKRFREALALSAGSVALYFVVAFVSPDSTMEQWGTVVATGSIFLLYLPALIMVLRRENTGQLPEIVERLMRRGA